MGHTPEQVQRNRLDETSFEQYWMMVYRRRWTVLGVIFVAVLATVLVSKRMEPLYRASSGFFVLMSTTEARGWAGAEGEAAVPAPGVVIADVYSEMLRGRDAQLRILESFPDLTLAELQTNVKIASSRTGLIEVTALDADPERAALLANAFVDYFPELVRAPIDREVVEEYRLINAEIERTERVLQEAREDRMSFLSANTSISSDSELQTLQTRRFDLEQSLERLKTRQEAVGRQIESLETSRFQDDRTALQAESAALEIEIDGTRQLLAETDARLRTLILATEELRGLETAASSQARGVGTLKEARRNLDMGSLQEADYHLVTKVATPPQRPSLPSLPFNLLLALALGISAGVSLALILGALEQARERREAELSEARASAWALLDLVPARD